MIFFFILRCVTAPLVSAAGTSQSEPPSGEPGDVEREQSSEMTNMREQLSGPAGS